MFDRSLIGNQRINFSTIVSIIQNTNFLYTLTNHIIEIDVVSAKIDQAVSFQNCLFVVSPSLSNTGLMLATTEGVRIENCRLEFSLCIWGELRANNVLGYLGQDGPNVFIENCEFGDFKINFLGTMTTFPPSIQISGLINHCRIISSDRLDVSFLQCKFFRAELQGSCKQFQLSETIGRELLLSNFIANYIWFQRELAMQVQKVEIDTETISNLLTALKIQNYPEHFVQPIKMFMDVLKKNRQGSLFLKMNEMLCLLLRNKKPNLIKNFIIYGLLKNFYSTSRMLLACVIVTIFFGLAYFLLVPCLHPNQSLLDWLYFSAVTFTTLGYGDIAPTGLLRIVAPIEALLGIVSVIITSWIFAREFSDF